MSQDHNYELNNILQSFDEIIPLFIELNGQLYKIFKDEKYWNKIKNKPCAKYMIITGYQNLLDIINNCEVDVIEQAIESGVKFEFTNVDFTQIMSRLIPSAQWCVLLTKLIPNIDLELLLIRATYGGVTINSEIDLVVGVLKTKGLHLNSGVYVLKNPAFLEIMLKHGFTAIQWNEPLQPVGKKFNGKKPKSKAKATKSMSIMPMFE